MEVCACGVLLFIFVLFFKFLNLGLRISFFWVRSAECVGPFGSWCQGHHSHPSTICGTWQDACKLRPHIRPWMKPRRDKFFLAYCQTKLRRIHDPWHLKRVRVRKWASLPTVEVRCQSEDKNDLCRAGRDSSVQNEKLLWRMNKLKATWSKQSCCGLFSNLNALIFYTWSKV